MDKRWLLAVVLVGVLAGIGVYAYRTVYFPRRRTFWRTSQLSEWIDHPAAHPDWMVHAGTRCGEAPFLFPTDGYIGYLWGDSFQIGKLHQGLDIFGGTDVGKTPVVAAYSGYLRRLPTWKSAVIMRIPEDPLQPGRQIWLYYTHMADPEGNSFISHEFPPGTTEKFVEAGTLLGYQGDYTGDPLAPSGIHLHFSIDLDDGQGGFRNELDIRNTLDPSPYLGIPLNAAMAPDAPPVCSSN
jgi:murein DD-endopeptidase MepM/ murein hydrolase activator NlpD